MVTVNSNPGNRNRPVRRLRFDGSPANQERITMARLQDTGHSGRRTVIVGVLALAVLAGGLALAFRDWRTRYRARAAFGASQVAPAIDPLARVVPPDVPRDAWRQTVAEAHDMLVSLTASSMLDLVDMQLLRIHLAQRVRQARPETARTDLTTLWNEITARAGPNLARNHPLPKLLSRKPTPR